MSEPPVEDTGWSALGRELWRRTAWPFRQVTFCLFFFGAILGLGGMGIWVELYSYLIPEKPCPIPDATALRTALLTFFPALAGTAAFQLSLIDDKRHIRALAIVLFLLTFAIAIGLAPSRISNGHALFGGVLGSALALWVWCIANANEDAFFDTGPIDSSTGGPVDKAILGNLDGLRVE